MLYFEENQIFLKVCNYLVLKAVLHIELHREMTACQEMIVDNPLLVISSVIQYNNLDALSLPTFKKQFEIDCFYLTFKKLKSV